MSFWSTPTLDPKRQFRFKVTFKGKGITSPVYIAQSADRPTYTISGGTKVHFLDKEFKYPGKVTWSDIKLGFIDGIANDGGQDENMAKQVYKYLTNSGFVSPKLITAGADRQEDLKTISKRDSIIQTVEIQPLRTDGSVVETYSLNNAFISSFTPSGFDYAQEGFSTLQVTLVYDWADFAST